MKLLSGTLARRIIQVAASVAILTGVNAQVADVRSRVGVPLDWSHYRLLVNREMARQNPALAAKEPRVMHALLRDLQARSMGTFTNGDEMAAPAAQQRDWNVALGTARVAFGMFPAKYSFDISAPPSCTGDYVVYALNTAGTTGGQANLVAFRNLYAGTGGACGANPTILFSYNVTTQTGGRLLTSPSISEDGTKIAFVESTTTSSIFHVLTWKTGAGNGVSPTNSARPGTGNTAVLRSLTYAAADNNRSSPWIDYTNDTAYVGANNGQIYKITGVFKGTPALAGAPWPVLIRNNRRLTSPVFDRFSNKIFVGDASGGLFAYNVGTQVMQQLNVSTAQQSNASVLDTPLVDAFNGTVFATSSNDGTSAVLVEADTTTLAELARVRIGMGSSGGTFVNLYDGAFSDAYFTSPASGNMVVCGTGAADITPWLYVLSFTGRIVNTTPLSSAQIRNSTRARCSPVTEFLNPNVGAGGTDFFFFGLSFDCSGANTNGCVIARTGTGATTFLSQPGGTSGIVIDNTSTNAQASNIYFSTQRQTFAAIKLTQNGLQ